MIEKLNRVFEKLPPEHRDIMREAFTILIEEVINAVIKDNERIWQSIEKIWQTMKEGFERQEKKNKRIWQNVERIWQTMNERFERQEKENERIWQNIVRIWQAIEKLEKTIKEGFERMNRKIEGLGARWGLMAEETFRAGLKKIIEDLG